MYHTFSGDGLLFEMTVSGLQSIPHAPSGRFLCMLAGQDVPDHVVQRLSYHSNWLGVKECTGNRRIQGYSDQGIMCWSGNDDEAHDCRHEHGGQVLASGILYIFNFFVCLCKAACYMMCLTFCK